MSQLDYDTKTASRPSYLTVSVVIVTFNSEKTIGSCLKSVIEQSVPPKEIVIVDGGSSDNTISIISSIREKTHLPFFIVNAEKKTRGFCRNIGIQNSSSEIVAFLDSDCKAPADWVKNIVYLFRDSEGKIAARGGPYVPLESSSSFSKMTYHLLGALTGRLTTQFLRKGDETRFVTALPGGNCAFSKKIVEEIDGFDPKMDICEDTEVSNRLGAAGHKLEFRSSLFVYHDWSGWKGLRKLASAALGYGEGRIVASKSSNSLFPSQYTLLFLFLTLGIIAEFSLTIVNSFFVILPLATIAAYLVFAVILMAKNNSFCLKAILSPPVFMLFYGMGMFRAYLRSI